MDDIAALRLQIEWGADEALLDAPVDRFSPSPQQPSEPIRRPVKPQPARPAMVPPPAAGSPHESVPVLARRQAAAAPDLAALQAATDTFDACLLRATASTTVAPSGNPATGLVLIGEAPSADDDRAGHAFSGPLGQSIDRVLASAGLDRTALLLTLLVPWRPPGGRPLSESEIAQCVPFLQRLLALAGPRHLVLMGAGPLRALAPEAATLRQARGKWVDISIPGIPKPIPTLPIHAPDAWLKTPAARQTIWADLLLLRHTLSQS